MFTIRSEVVRVQRTYTQFERHFRLGRARLRCIFIYVRWQLQCLIRLSYTGRIVDRIRELKCKFAYFFFITYFAVDTVPVH